MGVTLSATCRLGAAIAAWLLMAGLPAPCQTSGPQPQQQGRVPRLSISGYRASQAQAYQVAMARYDGLMLTRPGAPMVVIPSVERFVWTWENKSERVQRIGSGLFRISANDCLSRFCRQVSCTEVAWPIFQCSDNSPRVMSIPDPKTVVFGNSTYSQVASPQ